MEDNKINNCEHDFFLASKSKELCTSLGSYGQWEHYKLGTLVCKKCGETKQVKLDVYIKTH